MPRAAAGDDRAARQRVHRIRPRRRPCPTRSRSRAQVSPPPNAASEDGATGLEQSRPRAPRRAPAGSSPRRCCRSGRCSRSPAPGRARAARRPRAGCGCSPGGRRRRRSRRARGRSRRGLDAWPRSRRSTAWRKVSWPFIRRMPSSRPAVTRSRAGAVGAEHAGPMPPRAVPRRTTTAPAPSPNRAAVERSSGSMSRVIRSAPTTSTRPRGRPRPERRPARAPRRSPSRRLRRRSPRRACAPIRAATSGAAFGVSYSWLIVATRTRSTSSGVEPGRGERARGRLGGEVDERARRRRPRGARERRCGRRSSRSLTPRRSAIGGVVDHAAGDRDADRRRRTPRARAASRTGRGARVAVACHASGMGASVVEHGRLDVVEGFAGPCPVSALPGPTSTKRSDAADDAARAASRASAPGG